MLIRPFSNTGLLKHTQCFRYHIRTRVGQLPFRAFRAKEHLFVLLDRQLYQLMININQHIQHIILEPYFLDQCTGPVPSPNVPYTSLELLLILFLPTQLLKALDLLQ